VARQRNNIYAVAADAVDLALDTAGTIGSMVGGVAHMIGIGSSGHEKPEADDAAERVARSLHQEVEAAKPRSHKARGGSTHVSKRLSSRSKKKAAA
jgi:hypothetical protein